MKALWLDGSELGLRCIPIPRCPTGWARVDVLRAGVCGTDLALARGMYGFTGTPGHEFVGRVAAGPRRLLGTRVTGEITVRCGRCRDCRRGVPGHCRHRRVLGIRGLHGAFADSLVLPVRNLHCVPQRLDDDVAVFAEPVAAALDAVRRTPRPSDGRVLVVGPGRLGQLVARALLHTGARVCCVGRSEFALAFLPRGVCTATRLPAGWRESFEAVVDCSGSASGLRTALDAVRPRGTVILKSTAGVPADIDLDRLVVNEVRLQGSRCGSIPQALRWLASGRIDPRPLITGREALDDAVRAFAAAASPSHLKVLVHP